MAESKPELTEQQKNILLVHLNVRSRNLLGLYLDNINVSNDYRVLADIIGFEHLEIMKFSRTQESTGMLLEYWSERPDLHPTIGKLIEYLEEMDRLDVISECLPLIIHDIERFLKVSPVQVPTISQSSGGITRYGLSDHNVDETHIMTIEDVECGFPQMYDAFVCFNPEGDDIHFVKRLISEVEKPPHNLKLFVPGRNDLAGSSTHTISASLIEHRCKRIVIIISKKYLQSQACDFQTKFAFCLSPGSRSKKLVPVLIEDCTVPAILRHITMCDYTKKDFQEWIWRRLVDSIRAPIKSMVWQKDIKTASDIKFNISSDYNQVQSSSPSTSSSSSSSSIPSSSSVSASSC